MSSTECPADATENNMDSEDKTTVENAEKEESELEKIKKIRTYGDHILRRIH